MAAAGALAEVGPARRGVDVVAADAMEGRLPPLAFKPAVIATVVVEPEPEEKQAHERAEDNRAGGEIEHAPQQTQFGRRGKVATKGISWNHEKHESRMGGEPRNSANDREWKAVGV